MIVADTNILSTFARIRRLDLLFQVMRVEKFVLPQAVVGELQAGLNKGLEFLRPILDDLTTGQGFVSADLTESESAYQSVLPKGLNAGEREGIAICASRSGAVLMSNDYRAKKYCRANRILFADLQLILRRLWQTGLFTQDEVRALIQEIEQSEPGMTIPDQHEIWY
jgi:predicted nucleic acid-binding protein